MANEFDSKIVRGFFEEISSRLGEAAIIARTADDLGKQGLGDRAFRTMLAVEPLIHEAAALLNASSAVRRRSRGHPSDID